MTACPLPGAKLTLPDGNFQSKQAFLAARFGIPPGLPSALGPLYLSE